MLRARGLLLCVTVLGLSGANALAEDAMDWAQGELIPFILDSGKASNPKRDPAVVFEQMIIVEDAAWMRLYFADASLPPGSYVRMTAMLDGNVQECDAGDLAMWNYTSAYFNGDSVLLELIAAPGSFDNWISLDEVAVSIAHDDRSYPCHPNNKGICFADDRVPSEELWTARLLPAGCTASIYNTSSCAVTAGHCCSSGEDDLLEFNVPLSWLNCDIVHPPAADQFPVIDRVCLPLPDWSVMIVGTNGLGETPYERYGVYRPIASAPASPGEFVEIWSYGTDNTDPPLNQTQQYSSGAIVFTEQWAYLHNLDITFGSSGAAVLRNDEIVGIQSGASYDCQNSATRVDVPDFVTARDTLCQTSSAVSFADAPAHRMYNHPNPFNTTTSISFALSRPEYVRLRILDVAGGEVTTLIDGPCAPGSHQIAWDGRDDSGRHVTSGFYFSELATLGHTEARGMLLLR